MPIPQSVAEVLRSHVTLEVECIDRMYLNVYVPQLQREGGVVGYLRDHRGHPFASTVMVAPISRAFVEKVEQFAKENRYPIVPF